MLNPGDCALGDVHEDRPDRTGIRIVGERDRVPVAAPSNIRQPSFCAAGSSQSLRKCRKAPATDIAGLFLQPMRLG
jgi:hypothetical protein